jgi:hypothetical protein
VLDRVVERIVLDNVRQQLRLTRRELVADVRSHGDLPLARYLEESGRELADVYKHGAWTTLRRDAGLPALPAGPDETALLKRAVAFAHVDDPERAELYIRLADPDGPGYDALTEREQCLARMLFFLLWPNCGGHESYADGLTHLRRHPAVCAEIRELVALGLDRARHVPRPLGEGLMHVPLQSHVHYRREEVLAALGWASMSGRKAHGHAQGVAWAEATQTDALLVNLRKTERDFSPTTMYRDYAISPEQFHWESQNSTTVASEPGQRYLHHRERGTHVALFVRETPTDDLGPAPFLCLGTCTYDSHTGERPIAITWRLRRPMPGETFRSASVVA